MPRTRRERIGCPHGSAESSDPASDIEGLGTMWGRQSTSEWLSDAGIGDIGVTTIAQDRPNSYLLAS